MKLLNQTKPKNFLDLPEKKQKALLLKAAKGANKRQQELEREYFKLRPKTT